MFNKQELTTIIFITIIIAFSINLVSSGISFLTTLGFVFLVLMINSITKKIAGFYLDSEIEIKLWEWQRYGFKPHKYFKRPFPAGAFFPLISKIFLFPFKSFVWMASLVFEVKPKVYRAAKRHGLYKFSEMTEYHLGLIAFFGILVNLIFAIIGYLIGYTEFSRINIYYALFNIIPLSDLDGNKIFFGSIVLWSFLASLVLLGILLSILVI